MSLAALVTKDKYSFSVDSFYVETSGHNLHRRATVSELQALFDRSPAAGGPNTPDPVGHWYEAQLLHYGLAPSKNKAVAKVRLLDALRAGGLNVPKDILKVEGDLKKEWKKKDKETKSGSRSGGTAKSSTSGNNKRKRDDEDTGRPPRLPRRQQRRPRPQTWQQPRRLRPRLVRNHPKVQSRLPQRKVPGKRQLLQRKTNPKRNQSPHRSVKRRSVEARLQAPKPNHLQSPLKIRNQRLHGNVKLHVALNHFLAVGFQQILP